MTRDRDAAWDYDPADEPAPAPRWTHPNDPAAEEPPVCSICGVSIWDGDEHGHCPQCELTEAILEAERRSDAHGAVVELLQVLQALIFAWRGQPAPFARDCADQLQRAIEKRRL